MRRFFKETNMFSQTTLTPCQNEQSQFRQRSVVKSTAVNGWFPKCLSPKWCTHRNYIGARFYISYNKIQLRSNHRDVTHEGMSSAQTVRGDLFMGLLSCWSCLGGCFSELDRDMTRKGA